MFHRILIANRGEVALRVLRACRELGVETVAAYSREDANLPHLELASRTVCIGAGGAATSYLDKSNILMAARTTGCDAIHPGYGFLAENAEFARQAEEAGVVFIGPSPALISAMGDKLAAKDAMAELGLSVLPGTAVGESRSPRDLLAASGLPAMIKAVAGGGGRGMRIVARSEELARALDVAGHEAEVSFGDGRLYLERYLERARHVEVQILGDGAGRSVHLGTRDCSVQRRHQKLLEEAPAPGIDPKACAEIAAQCVDAAKAMEYRGAGTFEFLFAEGAFHFIEMNTRLQVEHPATEMVTGIDIVKEQIRVAAGDPLRIRQEEVILRGHAIECRINAEDAAFNPAPGRVTRFDPPGGPGVRLDTHLYAGYEVPHQFDSLVAKLICHGGDREEAIDRMARALEEFRLEGIESNIPAQRALVEAEAFRSATHFGALN